MVERRANGGDSRSARSELEDSLRIDKDDLDTCLVEQPGLFFHVAEEVSVAASRRDALKLDLEELLAAEDGKFRSLCARNEEKVTEAAIQNYLRTLPVVQELQRKLLDARTKADNWAALKEAYQQRSFMLRELVALHLAQIHNLGVERGAVSARHALADVTEARVGQARRDRRAQREGAS